MSVVAMMVAVFGLWRFVSRRAGLILMAFLAFGIVAYWIGPSQSCGDKAWFCLFMTDKGPIPQAPEPCPPDQPIDTRIFESDAANAELQRLIQSGVCQQVAIARIAKGWNAPYDPAYKPGLSK